jgi:membrane fusion protein, heavy metal efflux system
MKWKLPVAVVILGSAAAVFTFNERANTWAREAFGKLGGATTAAAQTLKTEHEPAPTAAKPPFDGSVAIDSAQLETLGVKVVEAKAQVEPTRIEVNGRTDYDQDTLTQIRPRFSVLVDLVHVQLGRRVSKRDPLVEIFSTDLAKAKSDYEKAESQWDRDKRQLARSESLFKKGAISEKDYLEDVNDERKSAVDAKVALDTLLLYGMTREEIHNVPKEEGEQKGKMTIRSPVDGIVTKRDVAPGVLYDVTNVLLVIAPLDHFWVWGNVYPSDAARVQIDQPWVIECKFIGRDFIRRKVDSISSNIDPDTKTVRVRTTIDNQAVNGITGRLKADMMVTGYIEVAPLQGRTVVPRNALVSADGADYVFVKVAGAEKSPDRFVRRSVRVVQEKNDEVIIAEGLKAGEMVASRGSLILAQLYEDATTTQTGMPQ